LPTILAPPVALQLRYLVRLYVKELVLKSFAGSG